MSDPIALPSPPATPEPIIMFETRKPDIHEFWTRAGEVKNLAREFQRLKRSIAAPTVQDGHI